MKTIKREIKRILGMERKDSELQPMQGDLEYLTPLMRRRIRKVPDFFFVQIGANDGVSFDPIYEFVVKNNLAGLVVEPLADIYGELVKNYSNSPRVVPVNVGIHKSERRVEIHRVMAERVEKLGHWTKGIASFRPEHRTLSGTPSDAMKVEVVDCVTMTEFLEGRDVQRIDLLQIDTEGYDSEIISMLDFNRWRPAIIRFEHGMPNGIMDRSQFKSVCDCLYEQGYSIITEEYDAIAYLPAAIF